MGITQKQRLEEAYKIHSRFHNWMGFLVCDGEEDMLSLRILVKKIEREAIKRYKIREVVKKIFLSENFIEQTMIYEKVLQKGINLLKNDPNQTNEIIGVATRLSYLRGRLFEQNKKEDLQDAYNIAMMEITKLRKKLGYD
jgi:hypothetical protein